ncbi:MAP7 domain-containing protein 1 isoform X3 [Anoplophora glabripennis]|uniref:MAP7 domain-containing protein 1 isoform X3 n=1 Tax=Anoplophora glabripennis TaxID=217634 RepID=UPI000874378C|nr:MAP7 domain-containing protein 1 isoform X3 [Anoplophora glabripennis]
MAENGRDILEQSKTPVVMDQVVAHTRRQPPEIDLVMTSGKGKGLRVIADKEARLRCVKDRQNEERQKKLEEIKAQALAAQRFKEQKEEERRRRLEELRTRDDVRRQQVEERKRAINDAERDRLESILRRNQEREQRIEAKKRNEKSNIVFAFGSSTPRMLDPTDLSVSFWGQRRATSIQNITCSTSSLTRRQSERDLDVGNKKRATSATGLERSGESSIPITPAGCASGYTGRRRTDLVPTIPSRDSSFSSSRKSLNHSPGRAYSMSRLDQLAKPRRRPDLPSLAETSPNPRPLSSPRISSVTRSMSHLAVSKSGPSPTRRPLSKADSRSMHHLSGDGALSAPRTTRTTQLREQKLHVSSNCSEASSRPSSSLSQQSTNSVTSSVSVSRRPAATPRRPRPASIAVTGITHDLKNSDKSAETKPPLPKTRKSISRTHEKSQLKNKIKSPVDSIPKEKIGVSVAQNVVNKAANDEAQQKPPDTAPVIQQKPTVEDGPPEKVEKTEEVQPIQPSVTKENSEENVPDSEKSDIGLVAEKVSEQPVTDLKAAEVIEEKPLEVKTEKEEKREEIKTEEVKADPQTVTAEEITTDNLTNAENNEMTTSITKVRINTEEEAKAALAERRRLIREEAERQAELERLRIEAEAKAELERQQREEEQVRQLIELQRQAEQERLKEAIREAQKREEEERLKREEEQRLKLLKEEAEKKAREDAERQKAELQERLKNEEKEREARRKRVEAIMLRTRGKNNANLPSQQSTDDKNENKSEEENKVNEENKLNVEEKLNEENKKNDDNKLKEENKVNGTKIVDQQENGTTKNGKDVDIVDNIIPAEIVKNANTVAIETMNSTDTINSNNSWQDTQQYDSLM